MQRYEVCRRKEDLELGHLELDRAMRSSPAQPMSLKRITVEKSLYGGMYVA